MVKSETLELFISSPSDVDDERKIIKSVIDELNDSFMENFSLNFHMIDYNRNIPSSIGENYQEKINEYVDSCDIFVGIFWSRYGSSTENSDSGSIEEFKRFYNRIKKNEPATGFLFFKKENIPFDSDPEQLSKLQKFKEKIKNKKCALYKEFESTGDFEKLFTRELNLKIPSWNLNKNNIINTNDTNVSNDNTDDFELYGDEKIELGYFDYIDISKDSQEQTISILDEIGVETEKFATNINEDVVMVNSGNQTTIKTGINKASDHMKEYSEYLDTHGKKLSEYFSKFLDSSIGLIDSSIEMGGTYEKKDVESLISETSGFENIMLDNIDKINELKNVVKDLPPRVSGKFERSKRNLISVLSNFIKELEYITNLTKNSKKEFEKYLDY